MTADLRFPWVKVARELDRVLGDHDEAAISLIKQITKSRQQLGSLPKVTELPDQAKTRENATRDDYLAMAAPLIRRVIDHMLRHVLNSEEENPLFSAGFSQLNANASEEIRELPHQRQRIAALWSRWEHIRNVAVKKTMDDVNASSSGRSVLAELSDHLEEIHYLRESKKEQVPDFRSVEDFLTGGMASGAVVCRKTIEVLPAVHARYKSSFIENAENSATDSIAKKIEILRSIMIRGKFINTLIKPTAIKVSAIDAVLSGCNNGCFTIINGALDKQAAHHYLLEQCYNNDLYAFYVRHAREAWYEADKFALYGSRHSAKATLWPRIDLRREPDPRQPRSSISELTDLTSRRCPAGYAQGIDKMVLFFTELAAKPEIWGEAIAQIYVNPEELQDIEDDSNRIPMPTDDDSVSLELYPVPKSHFDLS